MFIRLNRKKGQSTLEYAIVIGVIVAALLAINIYMKRAKEGRLRSSIDQIGEQFDAKKTSVFTHTENSGVTAEYVDDGETRTVIPGFGAFRETTKVRSTEDVKPWTEEEPPEGP